MNGKLIRLSIIGMAENNKYDAMGELFHQKLKHHQIPVDDNGWNEIERRLDEPKNKAVIWLWLGGTAAAVVAALLIINLPATKRTTEIAVSQQITPEETKIANHEAIPIVSQEVTNIDVVKSAGVPANNSTFTVFQNPSMNNTTQEDFVIDNQTVIQLFNDSAVAENNQELSTEEYKPSETIPEKEMPKLNIWLTEEETVAKRDKKWLLAASFGMGRADEFQNSQASTPTIGSAQPPKVEDSKGIYNNSYATEMSANVRSFEYLSKNDFTNVSHNPPLSVGLTVRKNLGRKGGVETGLVYTNLVSHFEWSDWSRYTVRQNLHYVGIPLNLAVYILDRNPNWRIYLSGGFTVEKGLRAIYRQERQWGSQVQNTTAKKNSIDGLQWSLNSALGVNYKIEKGWGIYFEPRVGYSFDCDQPASIRTEWPVYFGINLGLNYEL